MLHRPLFPLPNCSVSEHDALSKIPYAASCKAPWCSGSQVSPDSDQLAVGNPRGLLPVASKDLSWH